MGLSSSSLLDNSKIYSAISFDNIYYLHNNLILDYQYVRSINENILGNGQSLNFEYDSSLPLTFSYDMEVYDKKFNISKVGFNERNNLKNYELKVGYKNMNPLISIFRKYRLDLMYNKSENFDDLNIGDQISLIGRFYTNKYNKISIGYVVDNEHHDDYYMYDYELEENGPAFLIPKTNRSFVKYSSDTKRKFHYATSFASSLSVNRDRLFESRFNVSSNLSPSFNLKLGFEQILFKSSFDFLEIVKDDQDESINHYIFSKTNGWNNSCLLYTSDAADE